MVVNWGAGQQPFLEEFAYDGTRYNRIMAVGLPNSGNSYRTIKYLPSEFDINMLRSTAGGSVTSLALTESPPPVCVALLVARLTGMQRKPEFL